jgi:hypothetical protein
MRWQILAVSAGLVGALAGCQSSKTMARPDPQPAALSRSQKPDPARPAAGPEKTLLDVPPQDPGDPGVVRVCASIRATVNGKAILDEEVRAACYGALRQVALANLPPGEQVAKQKEIVTGTLEVLIERELLYQEALSKLKTPPGQKFLEKLREYSDKDFQKSVRSMKEALGKKTDEEVKEYLREQGLSLEGIRKQKERQFIAEEFLRQMVMGPVERINHEQVVDYYRLHPEEFQATDAVDWQDIFIDAAQHPSRQAARQAANEAATRARANEDFKRLAEQYSSDFRFTKGEGYGHRHGEVRPAEVEPVLFSLREGQVAIVEIKTGFHVIRVKKRDYAGLKRLDEKLQTQIKDKLRNEVAIREQKRYLNQLKSKAVIEYSTGAP